MCPEYGNEGRAELAMFDGARSQTAEVNFDCQVGQVFYGDILDVSVIHGDLVLGSGGTLDSKVLVSLACRACTRFLSDPQTSKSDDSPHGVI